MMSPISAMEAKMITLKFLAGYWTVLVDNKPIVSFASLDAAITAVPEVAQFQAAA